MTNDQFRALESLSGNRSPSGIKADDLLAAAISGFGAITRPARHDIQQLEDLALPLLDCASARGKRHAAATLAQLEHAPRKIVLKLCDEPVEIAAPLLLRSNTLTSADLIDIIGKHGLGHARAIARRQSDDSILQSLLESLADPAIDRAIGIRNRLVNKALIPPVDDALSTEEASPLPDLVKARESIKLLLRETSSEQLIASLRPHTEQQSTLPMAEQLIDTSLLIDTSFFRNTLADALGITFERAQMVIGNWPDSQLPIALKALGLTAQDCYMVLTAVLGTIQGNRDTLRDFVHIYRSIERENAMQMVRRWKSDDMTSMLRQKLREMAAEGDDQPMTDAANSDAQIQHKTAL